MKKLDVIFDKTEKRVFESVGLSYMEGEPDLNDKIRVAVKKICSDELCSTGDLTEYVLNNFSQEEAVLMAGHFLHLAHDNMHRKERKEKKRMKKITKNSLGALAQILSASGAIKRSGVIEISSGSKEEMISQIKEQFAEKGIEINTDPLFSATNRDEFEKELNSQLMPQGILAAAQISKTVFAEQLSKSATLEGSSES